MATFEIHVDISGPIFDGHAEVVANEVVEAAVKEIGTRARREIVAEAWTMNKSGRAGTGPGGFWAPRNVYMYDNFGGSGFGDDTVVIRGGQVPYLGWWPWLEGTSKRNTTTSFKGYHTFERTASRWQALGGMVLEDKLRERIAEMGGGP